MFVFKLWNLMLHKFNNPFKNNSKKSIMKHTI